MGLSCKPVSKFKSIMVKTENELEAQKMAARKNKERNNSKNNNSFQNSRKGRPCNHN